MADSNVNKLSIVLEGNSEKLQAALKAASTAMTNFDSKAKKTGGKDSGLGGILGIANKLAPALGAAFAVREIAAFGKEAVIAGAKLEGIRNAFQLIEDTGKTSLGVLKEATRGAVDEMTLMGLAVQAKNFQVPLENLAEFFEFATIRAAQTGESVDYLTRSIVIGIGRKSPLILDNLGITLVRLKEAMGKVGRESATVAEISAAVALIAREETTALKNLGLATETAAQKIARLTASFSNFKAAAGEDITSSGTFAFITDFIDNIQQETSVTRMIDDLQVLAGLSFTELNKEFGEIMASMEKGASYESARIQLASRLQEILKTQMEGAKATVSALFGDPAEAAAIGEWFNKASEGYKQLAASGLDANGQISRAINTLYKEESEKRSLGVADENAKQESVLEYLSKYKAELKFIETQYELGFITKLDRVNDRHKVLQKAITEMTIDSKKLGLAKTEEYNEWTGGLTEVNELLEETLILEAEASRGLGEKARYLEEIVDSYLKINALTEASAMNDAENGGFNEGVDREEMSIVSQDEEDHIRNMVYIGRLQKENIITQEQADSRKLSALNAYLEVLSNANRQIPSDLLAQRDALEGTLFDEGKIENLSQMWSSLSSSMGQLAGAFDSDSSAAKMLRLAQSIAGAAAAMSAFAAIADPSAPLRSIAAAAAVAASLAGIVGSVGNVSGGFGGKGSSGFSSNVTGSQGLYTEISGRNLRIILDRDGKLSDRRG
jgi:hypothetical protein